MTSLSGRRSTSRASESPNRRESRSRSTSRRHNRGSDFDRSGSRSSDRSHSHSRSRSRSCSGSRYSRSHSRSHSRSKRSGRSRSWSHSPSHSGRHRSYLSGSRSRSHSRSSRTRSRSSSYRDTRRHRHGRHRRHSYGHSSSRSRSLGSSGRSRSRSPGSPHSLRGGKFSRDRVKWNNAIWLVGEKAKDVVFHFCDVCDLPVVIYGRLLPCKHVLCFNCATKLPNKCNRCNKTVHTIERCLVGGIFMCFESDGCRRTYLSQRDLQAHINHRHKGGAGAKTTTAVTTSAPKPTTSIATVTTTPAEPTGSAIPSLLSKTKMDDPLRGLHQPRSSHGMSQKKSLSTSLSMQQTLKNPSTSGTVMTSPPSNTSCFAGTGKPMGLLPLPTPPGPQTGGRLPPNASHSLRLRGLGPFPTLAQFSTPPPSAPPPDGARNIPPLAVMNPSIPPPSLPTPSVPPPSGTTLSVPASLAAQQQQQQQQQQQVFGNASALAALAAALNVQSKASSLASRPENVLNPAGSLQTTGINLSLLSNVLRSASTAWGQAGTQLPNLSNIAQQANLQTSNQLLNNRPGGLNMRRFPP